MTNTGAFDRKHMQQYISVVAAAFTFFTGGLQLGGMSPVISILQEDGYHDIPPISNVEKSWLNNCLTLGILPGALIVSYANDIVGRKYSMMLSTVPVLLAEVTIYFATNSAFFYISTLFRGMACAWGFSVIPMYVSEIALASLRGPFTVFCMMFMIIGSSSGSMIQAAVSIELTAIICSVCALLSALILLLATETPYFYVTKNKDEESKKVLRKLRGEINVDKEFEEIKDAWIESQRAKEAGWLEILTVPLNLKVFLICAGVQSIQQFTGHLVMNVNIHTIVKNIDLNLSLLQISLIVTCVSVLATIVSILVVDSWGRKPLMITVCLGAMVGHLLTGVGFFLEDQQDDNSTALGLMELTGAMIYLAMIGLGLMHLPNILGAELFPTEIKSKGCSLLMVVSSLEGVIVSFSFEFLADINYYVPFFTMAGVSFLGVLFGIFVVPETKNRSLSEIQQQLK